MRMLIHPTYQSRLDQLQSHRDKNQFQNVNVRIVKVSTRQTQKNSQNNQPRFLTRVTPCSNFSAASVIRHQLQNGSIPNFLLFCVRF